MMKIFKGLLSRSKGAYSKSNNWAENSIFVSQLNRKIDVLTQEKGVLEKLLTETASERNNLKITNEAFAKKITDMSDLYCSNVRLIERQRNVIAHYETARLFVGDKYYNDADHKAPVLSIMGRFNDWYLIHDKAEERPKAMNITEFKAVYGHYVKLKKIDNRKKVS